MPHHPAHGGAAGATPAAETTVNTLPLAPGQVFVFFGDSISAPPSYVNVLDQALAHTRRDLGLRLINAGIPGNTVRDLEARLDRDVLDHHPTWVPVCIGANDYLWAAQGSPRGVPLDEFIGRYAALLDRLRAAGAGPILLTIPILGRPDDEDDPIPDPGPYNAAILALAARAGLPAVDLHRAFYEVHERAGNYKQVVRLSDDGIHPNHQGHALIARALVAQLGLLRKG
jgi:lysophospholipase L1-like esterase